MGMAKYQIEDIKILIADPNRLLRTSLKGVLHQYGFRGITDVANAKDFEEAIKFITPDLILCDVGLQEGNACDVIRRLRHNQVGQNPFAAVILFIEEATGDVVRMAAGAGVDDLQIKPVVGQKIIDRVTYLVEKRKPFVVTTDYIGPDRRKVSRPGPGAQEVPLIDVPNSLQAKATGSFDPRALQREISTTLYTVNAQKIERHVFQVGYLVERIVPAYRNGEVTKENMQMVIRLMQVASDIVERLEDSDYTHIADLADTLVTVTKSVWDSGTKPKNKDLDLLPELSLALSATFNTDLDASGTVAKIKSSVKDKYKV